MTTSDPAADRRDRAWLVGILLFSLATRLLFVAFVAPRLWQLNQTQEGNQGLDIAKNIVAGNGFLQHFEGFDYYNWRPPVFPLFLAGILVVFGLGAIKYALAVVSAAVPLLAYLFGRQIFDRRTGLIAAAITAATPSFIYSNGWPSPEAVMSVLALATGILLYKMLDDDRWWVPFLAGVFVALSALCRSFFLMLLGIIPVWRFLLRDRGRRWIRQLVLVGVGAMVTFTPWMIRNYNVHGKFNLATTDGGNIFFAANVPSWLLNPAWDSKKVFYPPPEYLARKHEPVGLSELERDKWFWREGLEYVKQYPGAYVKRVFERVWHLWKPYPYMRNDYSFRNYVRAGVMVVSWLPTFLLAMVAVYWTRSRWREFSLLYLLMLGMTAATALIHAVIRYRVPLEPFFIVFAAFTISQWWTRRRAAAPSRLA